MRSRFYLSLLLISGLILFVFIVIAFYREISPEWKRYQTEYRDVLIKKAKDEAARGKARSLKIEQQQIYLESLKRVDRCMNCHIGVDNPLVADAQIPFRQHSGDYLKNHPIDKFGCTVCHYGQGRATDKKEAHGIVPVTQWDYPIAFRLKTPPPKVEYPGAGRDIHWDFPIIPLKYIQSSCAQCHDLEMLKNKGIDKVVRGEKLFREKGCRGCHKLNDVGGDIGKALDVVGSQPHAYFPMRSVKDEKTVYSWMKQHFIDPREIVPESEMKVSVTDDEAELLSAYMLSLRSEEMPKSYRRIKYTRIPERPGDGEGLYKMFCIACHTTGKDSYFDEIFNRTIPAIMNPALLKITDDKYLKKVVDEGRAGTQMTSWKASAAGLTDHEVNKIIEYITKERPKAKVEHFGFERFKAESKRGEELYNIRCALCHGKKGEGALGLNLRNPVVQQADSNFLATTVRNGRTGTPMPPFGKDGVGLADQDIADIVSYVKTISKKK